MLGKYATLYTIYKKRVHKFINGKGSPRRNAVNILYKKISVKQ